MKLEKIEWIRVWYEDMVDRPERRVLLLGDSITEGYRPYVSGLLENTAADSFCTSMAVDNPNLLPEIQRMITRYALPYEAVHISFTHGGHLSGEEHTAGLDSIIRSIRELLPGKPVILGLMTPYVYPETGETDPVRNERVLKRNEAIIRYGKEQNIPVEDLYHAVENHPEYRGSDFVHMNAQGSQVLAAVVAGSIRAALGIQ